VIRLPSPREIFPVYPAVLVTCGKNNIISVGMCIGVSFEPPLIAVSIGHTRYSNELIRKGREFAVNIPVRGMEQKIKICGSCSGKDTDKFEKANLKMKKAKKISVPLIEECPVNIECKVVDEIEAGDHTIFIGKIVETHAKEGYDPAQSLVYKGGVFYSLSPCG
jgi:flavin reductase (DIM6/NTAB) family NADH-FMN oxidoreductase RutF